MRPRWYSVSGISDGADAVSAVRETVLMPYQRYIDDCEAIK
jgi:hypothetical protein